MIVFIVVLFLFLFLLLFVILFIWRGYFIYLEGGLEQSFT